MFYLKIEKKIYSDYYFFNFATMEFTSCNTSEEDKCFLGCRRVLTQENVMFFNQLMEERDYQKIEEAFFIGGKTPVDELFNLFLHWMIHQPLEYLQEVFNDRIGREVKIIQLHCSEDEMLEGFLIYALIISAAFIYRKNLDKKNVVRNYDEKGRKKFNSNDDRLKRQYIDKGTLPAFIVNYEDLDDNVNERWYKIRGWFAYIEKLKSYHADEFRFFPNWIIKFLYAQRFKTNLDKDDCVNILSQTIEHFSNAKINPYYGLHIVSDDEQLSLAIYVILQPEFKFPLVIHDFSHKELDDQSQVCSGYNRGSFTFLGTYDVSKKFKLAFKSYTWYEKEECYMTNWLVFEKFDQLFRTNPVSVGIWWSSS
jgi:hypothetical protein